MNERTFLLIWLTLILVTWPPQFWFTIRSRRKRGEPLRPQRPEGALYYERAASGTARGWIAGASNALIVAVTRDELWIGAPFPFTLFFPYGAFNLDHRVPKNRVVRVEPIRSWMGFNIELELPGRDGRRNAELKLKVRDPAGFMAALRQAG